MEGDPDMVSINDILRQQGLNEVYQRKTKAREPKEVVPPFVRHKNKFISDLKAELQILEVYPDEYDIKETTEERKKYAEAIKKKVDKVCERISKERKVKSKYRTMIDVVVKGKEDETFLSYDLKPMVGNQNIAGTQPKTNNDGKIKYRTIKNEDGSTKKQQILEPAVIPLGPSKSEAIQSLNKFLKGVEDGMYDEIIRPASDKLNSIGVNKRKKK